MPLALACPVPSTTTPIPRRRPHNAWLQVSTVASLQAWAKDASVAAELKGL